MFPQRVLLSESNLNRNASYGALPRPNCASINPAGFLAAARIYRDAPTYLEPRRERRDPSCRALGKGGKGRGGRGRKDGNRPEDSSEKWMQLNAVNAVGASNEYVLQLQAQFVGEQQGFLANRLGQTATVHRIVLGLNLDLGYLTCMKLYSAERLRTVSPDDRHSPLMMVLPDILHLLYTGLMPPPSPGPTKGAMEKLLQDILSEAPTTPSPPHTADPTVQGPLRGGQPLSNHSSSTLHARAVINRLLDLWVDQRLPAQHGMEGACPELLPPPPPLFTPLAARVAEITSTLARKTSLMASNLNACFSLQTCMYRLLRFSEHMPLRHGVSMTELEPDSFLVPLVLSLSCSSAVLYMSLLDTERPETVYVCEKVLRDVIQGLTILEIASPSCSNLVLVMKAHLISQLLGMKMQWTASDTSHLAADLSALLDRLTASAALDRHPLIAFDCFHRLGDAQLANRMYTLAARCYQNAAAAAQSFDEGTCDFYLDYNAGLDHRTFISFWIDAAGLGRKQALEQPGAVFFHRDRIRLFQSLTKAVCLRDMPHLISDSTVSIRSNSANAGNTRSSSSNTSSSSASARSVGTRNSGSSSRVDSNNTASNSSSDGKDLRSQAESPSSGISHSSSGSAGSGSISNGGTSSTSSSGSGGMLAVSFLDMSEYVLEQLCQQFVTLDDLSGLTSSPLSLSAVSANSRLSVDITRQAACKAMLSNALMAQLRPAAIGTLHASRFIQLLLKKETPTAQAAGTSQATAPSTTLSRASSTATSAVLRTPAPATPPPPSSGTPLSAIPPPATPPPASSGTPLSAIAPPATRPPASSGTPLSATAPLATPPPATPPPAAPLSATTLPATPPPATAPPTTTPPPQDRPWPAELMFNGASHKSNIGNRNPPPSKGDMDTSKSILVTAPSSNSSSTPDGPASSNGTPTAGPASFNGTPTTGPASSSGAPTTGPASSSETPTSGPASSNGTPTAGPASSNEAPTARPSSSYGTPTAGPAPSSGRGMPASLEECLMSVDGLSMRAPPLCQLYNSWCDSEEQTCRLFARRFATIRRQIDRLVKAISSPPPSPPTAGPGNSSTCPPPSPPAARPVDPSISPPPSSPAAEAADPPTSQQQADLRPPTPSLYPTPEGATGATSPGDSTLPTPTSPSHHPTSAGVTGGTPPGDPTPLVPTSAAESTPPAPAPTSPSPTFESGTAASPAPSAPPPSSSLNSSSLHNPQPAPSPTTSSSTSLPSSSSSSLPASSSLPLPASSSPSSSSPSPPSSSFPPSLQPPSSHVTIPDPAPTQPTPPSPPLPSSSKVPPASNSAQSSLFSDEKRMPWRELSVMSKKLLDLWQRRPATTVPSAYQKSWLMLASMFVSPEGPPPLASAPIFASLPPIASPPTPGEPTSAGLGPPRLPGGPPTSGGQPGSSSQTPAPVFTVTEMRVDAQGRMIFVDVSVSPPRDPGGASPSGPELTPAGSSPVPPPSPTPTPPSPNSLPSITSTRGYRHPLRPGTAPPGSAKPPRRPKSSLLRSASAPVLGRRGAQKGVGLSPPLVGAASAGGVPPQPSPDNSADTARAGSGAGSGASAAGGKGTSPPSVPSKGGPSPSPSSADSSPPPQSSLQPPPAGLRPLALPGQQLPPPRAQPPRLQSIYDRPRMMEVPGSPLQQAEFTSSQFWFQLNRHNIGGAASLLSAQSTLDRQKPFHTLLTLMLQRRVLAAARTPAPASSPPLSAAPLPLLPSHARKVKPALLRPLCKAPLVPELKMDLLDMLLGDGLPSSLAGLVVLEDMAQRYSKGPDMAKPTLEHLLISARAVIASELRGKRPARAQEAILAVLPVVCKDRKGRAFLLWAVQLLVKLGQPFLCLGILQECLYKGCATTEMAQPLVDLSVRKDGGGVHALESLLALLPPMEPSASPSPRRKGGLARGAPPEERQDPGNPSILRSNGQGLTSSVIEGLLNLVTEGSSGRAEGSAGPGGAAVRKGVSQKRLKEGRRGEVVPDWLAATVGAAISHVGYTPSWEACKRLLQVLQADSGCADGGNEKSDAISSLAQGPTPLQTLVQCCGTHMQLRLLLAASLPQHGGSAPLGCAALALVAGSPLRPIKAHTLAHAAAMMGLRPPPASSAASSAPEVLGRILLPSSSDMAAAAVSAMDPSYLKDEAFEDPRVGSTDGSKEAVRSTSTGVLPVGGRSARSHPFGVPGSTAVPPNAAASAELCSWLLEQLAVHDLDAENGALAALLVSVYELGTRRHGMVLTLGKAAQMEVVSKVLLSYAILGNNSEACVLLSVLSPDVRRLDVLLQTVLRSRLASAPILRQILSWACLCSLQAAFEHPDVYRPLVIKSVMVAHQQTALRELCEHLAVSQVLTASGFMIQCGRPDEARVLLKHLCAGPTLMAAVCADGGNTFVDFMNGLAANTRGSDFQVPPQCARYVACMLICSTRRPGHLADLSKRFSAAAKRLAIGLCCARGMHVSALRLWSVWQSRHSASDIGRELLFNLLVACAEVEDWVAGESLLRFLSPVLPQALQGERVYEAYLQVVAAVMFADSLPRSRSGGSLAAREVQRQLKATTSVEELAETVVQLKSTMKGDTILVAMSRLLKLMGSQDKKGVLGMDSILGASLPSLPKTVISSQSSTGSSSIKAVKSITQGKGKSPPSTGRTTYRSAAVQEWPASGSEQALLLLHFLLQRLAAHQNLAWRLRRATALRELLGMVQGAMQLHASAAAALGSARISDDQGKPFKSTTRARGRPAAAKSAVSTSRTLSSRSAGGKVERKGAGGKKTSRRRSGSLVGQESVCVMP